eukprot:CAMPEP_0177766462 /NCGR_PEP_ID=MMETSP0491_2-20121128/8536_1 /TAXON_ID=63592 /ORGANISM="Tetraselmis chuii, Strain PLY429" /LENGTH=226 /DNA_ID=CAMNT_0019282875 /DNA_START=657 /DNA_END=1337 /DNA_ORIENTATION=-
MHMTPSRISRSWLPKPMLVLDEDLAAWTPFCRDTGGLVVVSNHSFHVGLHTAFVSFVCTLRPTLCGELWRAEVSVLKMALPVTVLDQPGNGLGILHGTLLAKELVRRRAPHLPGCFPSSHESGHLLDRTPVWVCRVTIGGFALSAAASPPPPRRSSSASESGPAPPCATSVHARYFDVAINVPLRRVGVAAALVLDLFRRTIVEVLTRIAHVQLARIGLRAAGRAA